MSSLLLLQRLAGALGAMGVSAGAYGSHLLEASWQTRQLDLDQDDVRRWTKAWHSAWIMNMSGSVATLALSNAPSTMMAHSSLLRRIRIPAAATLIGGGTLVFSVSTYAAAYYADRKYAMGGPLGGSATIAGWLVLMLVP